ncbi:MAG: hypothetical protein WCQ50_16235 [Spirochaetota bacterium]
MSFSKFTASLITVLGTGVGLYASVWVFLIGGILNLIDAFGPFQAGLFSFGLAKVLTCDVVFLTIFGLTTLLANWVHKENEEVNS